MMTKTRNDSQKELDARLTALLNNQAEVLQFMLREISSLNARIQERFKDRVIFYVKGGNALNLLSKPGETFGGWSDWDSHIIIDPMLEAHTWYEIFAALDTFLLEQLEGKWDQNGILREEGIQQRWLRTAAGSGDASWVGLTQGAFEAKRAELRNTLERRLGGLFGRQVTLAPQRNVRQVLSSKMLHPAQLNENILTIVKGITADHEDKKALDKKREEFFDQLFPVTHQPTQLRQDYGSSVHIDYTVPEYYLHRMMLSFSKPGEESHDVEGYRAELLDISIPRRETPSSLIQWNTIKERITYYTKDNVCIPVPDYEYHYEENVRMVFDVLSGRSFSPQKAMLRLKRAKDALEQLVSEKKEYFEQLSTWIDTNFTEVTSVLIALRESRSQAEYYALADFLRDLYMDYEFDVDQYAKQIAADIINVRLNQVVENTDDSVVKAMFDISHTWFSKRPALKYMAACEIADVIKKACDPTALQLFFGGDFALCLQQAAPIRAAMPVNRVNARIVLPDTADYKAISNQVAKALHEQGYTHEAYRTGLYVKRSQGDPLASENWIGTIDMLPQSAVPGNGIVKIQNFNVITRNSLLQDIRQRMSAVNNFHLREDYKRIIHRMQTQNRDY